MTTERVKLAEKLARIMATVKPLPKEGSNPQYKFVTVGQMLDLLRPEMAKAGIAILPKVLSVEYVDAGQTQGGAHKTACHMLAEFTLTDGAESLTVVSAGEAIDSGDKAATKAFTAAQKQALSKLFMISADEDNDNDAADEQRTAPVARQAAPRASGPSQYGICPIHKVAFFKTAAMRSPAHRADDAPKGWCNAQDRATSAPQEDADYDAWVQEQAEKAP